MKLIFKDSMYEEVEDASNSYPTNIAKYSEQIRELIYKGVSDKIFRTGVTFNIIDIAKRYGYHDLNEIKDLGIYFAKGNNYYYDKDKKRIILPTSILLNGPSKKDSIAIAHELEHYFQFKTGNYIDQGTLTNKENKNSDFSYNNDINEINARLSQITSFLINSPKFKEEISNYDFNPFVEIVVEKLLHMGDVNKYLDETLSEDNRNKLLEFLYLMWKKLKK